MQTYLDNFKNKLIKKYLIPIIIGLALMILIVIIIAASFMALFNNVNKTPYISMAGTPSEIAIAEIPPELLPIFIEAGEKYNVSWAILAAICKIESSFGSYPLGSVSSAGAVGIMQFMPTTWSGNSNPYLPRNDRNWRPSGEEGISFFYSSINDNNLPYDVNAERIARVGGYGVDADGDGYADPYNPYDAIYSTAFMLSKNIEVLEEEYYAAKMNMVLVHYSGGDARYAQRVMTQAKLYSFIEMPGELPIWPVSTTHKVISSPYGERIHPKTGKYSFHRGVDIAGTNILGADIYSIFDAKVTAVGYSRGEGWFVKYGNYKGDTSVYCCHILEGSLLVKEGDYIPRGTVIGKVGNSGTYSTGPHLHIEVVFSGKNIDPLPYLQKGLNTQIKLEGDNTSGNY